MFKKLKRLVTSKKGATGIEYGLIAAGIALVIITAVNAVGTSLSDTFTAVASVVAPASECDPNDRFCNGGGHGGPISDRRLKHDIHQLGATRNGIKLYSFKYLNDDTVFVGVMAQDLLEDDRFKSSVIHMPSGFYAVNYNRLGIKPANEMKMRQIGLQALWLAENNILN